MAHINLLWPHLLVLNHHRMIVFLSIKEYDQVSVNGYSLGTNSVKIISYQINIIFKGFIVLGGVKSIGIINFGKIFIIVLVYFL